MKEPNVKELFYEADTRKHQQIVAERLIFAAKKLLDRATKHDASKLEEPEKGHYIEPVFELNTREIPYPSVEHDALTSKMGEGWKHHESVNDHHIGFFVPYSFQTLNDPVRCLDLLCLLEMLCDWVAASKRRGNHPSLALDQMKKKYEVDEQLEAIIRNTLAILE